VLAHRQEWRIPSSQVHSLELAKRRRALVRGNGAAKWQEQAQDETLITSELRVRCCPARHSLVERVQDVTACKSMVLAAVSVTWNLERGRARDGREGHRRPLRRIGKVGGKGRLAHRITAADSIATVAYNSLNGHAIHPIAMPSPAASSLLVAARGRSERQRG
jgi:hypothetical protein